MVFWSHCFDTVETALPTPWLHPLLVTSLMSRTQRLVDRAGCCCNNVRAGGTVGFRSGVLCIHFGANRRAIVVERSSEARAVGRRCRVCTFPPTL